MDDRNFYRDLKKSRKRTGNRKRRRFFKEQIDSDDFEEKFDFGYNESASLNGRDGLNSKKKLNRRKRTPRPDKQVSLPPELPDAELLDTPQDNGGEVVDGSDPLI